MKKIILRNGLIAGLIVSVFMISGLAMGMDAMSGAMGMVVGFASMIIAFTFVFVAIRNYRDRENGGRITFGKAFAIGLLVSLIASTFYVITWLVIFYNFYPDFMDKYAAHVLDQMRHDGRSAAEIAEKSQSMHKMAMMYKTTGGVILLTYMEILPVGVLASLIAAAVFRRKAIEQA